MELGDHLVHRPSENNLIQPFLAFLGALANSAHHSRQISFFFVNFARDPYHIRTDLVKTSDLVDKAFVFNSVNVHQFRLLPIDVECHSGASRTCRARLSKFSNH